MPESNFPRWYVLAWARQGIFPPPLQGDPFGPGSVMAIQGARESELPPPRLDLSDEQAVELMEQAAETLSRGMTSPADGPSEGLSFRMS